MEFRIDSMLGYISQETFQSTLIEESRKTCGEANLPTPDVQ